MSQHSAPVRLFVPVIAALILITGVLVSLAQEAPPSDGSVYLTGSFTYNVRQGEILDLIAAFYDVDVDCVIQRNDLPASGTIYPGDQLLITDECPPYDGFSRVGMPRPLPGDQGGGGTISYYVRRNDTLDTIAQRFNLSLIALQQANNLPPGALLFPGTLITLPADAPPYGFYPALNADIIGQGGGAAVPGEILYTIQPLDVLDLIAAYFDVQLVCMVERNELQTPALIFPGQLLIIPSTCPPYDGLSPASERLVRGLELVQTPSVPLPPATPTPPPAIVEPTVMPTLPPTLPATQPPTAIPTLPPTPEAQATLPPVETSVPEPTTAPTEIAPTAETFDPTATHTITPPPVISGPTKTPTPAK